MSTFSKKYDSLPGTILDLGKRKRRAIEPIRLFVHDLIDQLAIIVGHCDLLSYNLEQGSQSATRVITIQDTGPMAQQLNQYRYRPPESVRSVRMQKKHDVV
jgi:hypothetical protein